MSREIQERIERMSIQELEKEIARRSIRPEYRRTLEAELNSRRATAADDPSHSQGTLF